MQSQGGREALMKQVVLSNTVNTEIQSTFDKVAGKYQDVLKLEQSVAELHQLFMDFALLTEQQGELLDSIEYNVQTANEHVECANEETMKAIEYQSAIRKKQWYVALHSFPPQRAVRPNSSSGHICLDFFHRTVGLLQLFRV